MSKLLISYNFKLYTLKETEANIEVLTCRRKSGEILIEKENRKTRKSRRRKRLQIKETILMESLICRCCGREDAQKPQKCLYQGVQQLHDTSIVSPWGGDLNITMTT